MKKIALVGGAGFIGHNLALYLSKENYIPYIIDDLSINNLNDNSVSNANDISTLQKRIQLLNQHNIEFIEKDAGNYELLDFILSQIRPNAIFHLAGVSHMSKAHENPRLCFESSLITLNNCLELARKYNAKLLFNSSSTVYGNFDVLSVDESTICKPIGAYATYKYLGEKMVQLYGKQYNLDYTIIRPSALYGPRCISYRITQKIPHKALRGEEIRISSPNRKLDFTHVDDFSEGIRLILNSKNSNGEVFNLTYGNARPISDLIEIAKEIIPTLKINVSKSVDDGPIRGTLSTNKAKKLLGYKSTNPINTAYRKYLKCYIENYAT